MMMMTSRGWSPYYILLTTSIFYFYFSTSENYWRDRRTSAGIAKGHRNLPGIIFIFLSVTGLDPLYDVSALTGFSWST